jgi:hypothetical protein
MSFGWFAAYLLVMSVQSTMSAAVVPDVITLIDDRTLAQPISASLASAIVNASAAISRYRAPQSFVHSTVTYSLSGAADSWTNAADSVRSLLLPPATTTISGAPQMIFAFRDVLDFALRIISTSPVRAKLLDGTLRVVLICFDLSCRFGSAREELRVQYVTHRIIYLDVAEFAYVTFRVAGSIGIPGPFKWIFSDRFDQDSHVREVASMASLHARATNPDCCNVEAFLPTTIGFSWLSNATVSVGLVPSCVNGAAACIRSAHWDLTWGSLRYSMKIGANDTRALNTTLEWRGPEVLWDCFVSGQFFANATASIPARCLSLSPSFPGLIKNLPRGPSTTTRLSTLRASIFEAESVVIAPLKNNGVLFAQTLSDALVIPSGRSTPIELFSRTQAYRLPILVRSNGTTLRVHDWMAAVSVPVSPAHSAYIEDARQQVSAAMTTPAVVTTVGAGVDCCESATFGDIRCISSFGRDVVTSQLTESIFLRTERLGSSYTRWTSVAAATSFSRPSSRSGHTMTFINDTAAVMFGGQTASENATSELWLLEVDGNSTSWTNLSHLSKNVTRRMEHAASVVAQPIDIEGTRDHLWVFWAFGESSAQTTSSSSSRALNMDITAFAVNARRVHVIPIPPVFSALVSDRRRSCFVATADGFIIAGGSAATNITAVGASVKNSFFPTLVYSFSTLSWSVSKSAEVAVRSDVSHCFYNHGTGRVNFITATSSAVNNARVSTWIGEQHGIPVSLDRQDVIEASVFAQWFGPALRCPLWSVATGTGLECDTCPSGTVYIDGTCVRCEGQFCGDDASWILGAVGAGLLCLLILSIWILVRSNYQRALRSEEAEQNAYDVAMSLTSGTNIDTKLSALKATRLHSSFTNILKVFRIYSQFLPHWVHETNQPGGSASHHHDQTSPTTAVTNPTAHTKEKTHHRFRRGNNAPSSTTPPVSQAATPDHHRAALTPVGGHKETAKKNTKDRTGAMLRAPLWIPAENIMLSDVVSIADVRFKLDYSYPMATAADRASTICKTYEDVCSDLYAGCAVANGTMLSLWGDRAILGFGLFQGGRSNCFDAACVALALASSPRFPVSSIGIASSDALVGFVGELFGRRAAVIGSCVATAQHLATAPLNLKRNVAAPLAALKGIRQLSVRCIGSLKVPTGESVMVADVRGVRGVRGDDENLLQAIEHRLKVKLHKSSRDYRMWNTVCEYVDKGQIQTAKKVLEGATVPTENRGELEEFIRAGALPPVEFRGI